MLGGEHKGDIENFSEHSEEEQGEQGDDDLIADSEDMQSTRSGSTTSSGTRRANAKFDEWED